MLTQCPHCLTLFRVGPEHLKAAAGDVRCCKCNQVFNALRNMQVSHDQAPIRDFESMPPKPAPTESPDGFFDGILERDDGLEPEPDYLASDGESLMSKLLDMDSSSILQPYTEELTEEEQHNHDKFVTTSAKTAKTPSEKPPIDEPAFEDNILKDDAFNEEPGKPDYHPAPAFRAVSGTLPEPWDNEDHTINFEAEKVRRPRSQFSLPWLVGSLLLLLPLVGQLAWLFRGDLIQHDVGRHTLNLICLAAGCETPQRRALDKIVIQGRNLSTHPDKPRTLFLQVSIVNTATFEQPFPQLTLSVYTDEGNLIARRSFAASDYLPPEFAHQSMMPKAQPILVEMELIDPGEEVTGFSFDFY